MWQFNGPAVTCLMVSIAVLLAFSLVFSFRDTVRALAEFFDIRAIRRLFRKPHAVGFALVLVGVLVSFWLLSEDPWDISLSHILAAIFLVPGLSLAWTLVAEVYDSFRTGRKRRR